MKHGKKYVDAAKLVDKSKLYEPGEALETVIKTSTAKFDETVELHVKLGVDSRHADQQVRGAVVLPNGTGKNVRVLAICKGANEELTHRERLQTTAQREILVLSQIFLVITVTKLFCVSKTAVQCVSIQTPICQHINCLRFFMTSSTASAWHGRITATTSRATRSFIWQAIWSGNMCCRHWQQR